MADVEEAVAPSAPVEEAPAVPVERPRPTPAEQYNNIPTPDRRVSQTQPIERTERVIVKNTDKKKEKEWRQRRQALDKKRKQYQKDKIKKATVKKAEAREATASTETGSRVVSVLTIGAVGALGMFLFARK